MTTPHFKKKGTNFPAKDRRKFEKDLRKLSKEEAKKERQLQLKCESSSAQRSD